MSSTHHHAEHHHSEKDQHNFCADGHRFQCSLHTHNGAVVLSFQIVFQGPLSAAEPRMKNLFSELSCCIDKQNGMIGHIKAYGKECSRSLSISCTNGTAESKLQEENHAEINGTAIVFRIDPQDFLTVFKENCTQIFYK